MACMSLASKVGDRRRALCLYCADLSYPTSVNPSTTLSCRLITRSRLTIHFFPLGRASEPSRPVRRLTPSTYSPPIIRRYRWSCRVSYRSFESTMITANGSAPPQALHRASAGRCRHFVRTVVLGIHNIHHPFVQENGRRQEEARILASLVQAQARTDAHSMDLINVIFMYVRERCKPFARFKQRRPLLGVVCHQLLSKLREPPVSFIQVTYG
ncbi:hypothetical protein BJV77DRAFT_756218 [Russula vinacea]|nr:hypothetical protein BJV77DRAFT_756218 [Russula vinacea]